MNVVLHVNSALTLLVSSHIVQTVRTHRKQKVLLVFLSVFHCVLCYCILWFLFFLPCFVSCTFVEYSIQHQTTEGHTFVTKLFLKLPLPSNRQYLSCDAFLEVKRDYYYYYNRFTTLCHTFVTVI